MGYFIAGEGRRFYGRTTPSATPNRQAMTVRQPLGVAGLIIAANTPIANVAWKVFPALLCGNAAVLKASEDTPETALAFARLAAEAGLPAGRAATSSRASATEAGQPLVEDPRVAVVSFTGSTAVGRMIARVAGERLAKVCLELGGKNPLVVCDDADLERGRRGGGAVGLLQRRPALRRRHAGSSSSTPSTTVPRAACSSAPSAQRVGSGDEHDFGPVINERQLENMLGAVERARAGGRDGAHRRRAPHGPARRRLLHGADDASRTSTPSSEISRTELFGPITTLHRVARLRGGARARPTTRPTGSRPRSGRPSIHRGQEFVRRVVAGGVASVNGPTYGCEPHMPFGGLRDSGNGWREAGTEALDVYSDWKTVYVNHDPAGP